MNGMQHMHISCRLLHTTLHVQPPKLILTGRFVKKNLPGLMDKTRKHMYTLHKLTSNDTVKVSIILPDGQTATLVCHRRRPPPPTPTHKASVVYQLFSSGNMDGILKTSVGLGYLVVHVISIIDK